MPRRWKPRSEPRWQESLMLARLCRLIRDGKFKRRDAKKALKISPLDLPAQCEPVLERLEKRARKASLEELEGLILKLALKAGVLQVKWPNVAQLQPKEGRK